MKKRRLTKADKLKKILEEAMKLPPQQREPFFILEMAKINKPKKKRKRKYARRKTMVA